MSTLRAPEVLRQLIMLAFDPTPDDVTISLADALELYEAIICAQHGDTKAISSLLKRTEEMKP